MDMEIFMDQYFNVLEKRISLSVFEQWVYATREIEKILPPREYLDLISINYKEKYAENDLVELVRRTVNPGDYEFYRISHLLKSIVNRWQGCEYAIMNCYDLYCKGYQFFSRLGFGYGIRLYNEPFERYGEHLWEDLSGQQKSELLDEMYPNIVTDAKIVLNLLLEKEIRLTGEILDRFDRPLGRYGYIDTRSAGERRTTDDTYKRI